MENQLGLPAWRWLFIIEGGISLGLGFIAFILLPDLPKDDSGSGKWLFTAEERQIAIGRMARDAVSNQEDEKSVMQGLKLAVIDIKLWIFVSINDLIPTLFSFSLSLSPIFSGSS